MDSKQKGKCYRVEERTIIPGPLATIRQVGGGFAGATAQVEQNVCFVVVNSQTEHYIGKDHTRVQFSSELRPSQFFISQAEAETFAKQYHQLLCPNAINCGWSN